MLTLFECICITAVQSLMSKDREPMRHPRGRILRWVRRRYGDLKGTLL